MRHLAIDYGTRRIGIAVSDEGGRLATPLAVLEVTSPDAALRSIGGLVAEHDARVLVVGLPLNMDESEGPAAACVRKWAAQLSEAAALPVVFVDERLSSFEAGQTLKARKQAGERMTRRGRKRRLDALAAAQLLQSYLDSLATEEQNRD